MDIKPISALIKWFLPLLLKRDESTHAEIIHGSKKYLDPWGAAVVMALWRVVVYKFKETPETYELLSALRKQYPPSSRVVKKFFGQLESISRKDSKFAFTLDYLYHSSESVNSYFVLVVRDRLAGDISTDAPPPKKKSKKNS